MNSLRLADNRGKDSFFKFNLLKLKYLVNKNSHFINCADLISRGKKSFFPLDIIYKSYYKGKQQAELLGNPHNCQNPLSICPQFFLSGDIECSDGYEDL